MTRENSGKETLEQDKGDGDSRIERREFLAMSGIAAVSVTGYLTGSADAATTAESTIGYGADAYGVYGYGGVETTSSTG